MAATAANDDSEAEDAARRQRGGRRQVDVFFLRREDDHVTRTRVAGECDARRPRNMEARPGENSADARATESPARSPRTMRHGHDNVCFDSSPPESRRSVSVESRTPPSSRLSMDSSFEGSKSISTVSSCYSVSFQSSLNELVSMSSSAARRRHAHKVRFQLDKTRQPYEDEWSLEDFRKLADPDDQDTSSVRRCGRAFRVVMWVFVCSGMCFCALLLHNVTSAGVTLLLSRIMVSTFTQISGNPIGLLLLGLWTWSMYSSAYLVPLLTSLHNVEGFVDHQVMLILLGANMANTFFPVLLSFAFVCDRVLFRRAFAAAILNYVYNVFTVLLILPVEVASGMLYHIGRGVTPLSLTGNGPQLFHTVISYITDLIVQIDIGSLENLATGNRNTLLRIWCSESLSPPDGSTTHNHTMRSSGMPAVKCKYLLDSTGLGDPYLGAILIAVCVPLFAIIYACAMQITKRLLRKSHVHAAQTTMNREMRGKCAPFTGCLVIIVTTCAVILFQNSFVLLCISLLLVATGFLSLRRYYEILLGTNIGGAVSLFLFAQASTQKSYASAMSLAASNAILHVFSALVWYPIPIMRRQPIKVAKSLAMASASYRWFGVLFVVSGFALVPLALYGLCLISGYVIIPVGLPFVLLTIVIIVINVMQQKCPTHLPNRLQSWDCLPLWMRSLEPLDTCLSRCCCCCCLGGDSNATCRGSSEATPSSVDCKDGSVDGSTSTVTSSQLTDVSIGNGHGPVSILKNNSAKDKRETIV